MSVSPDFTAYEAQVAAARALADAAVPGNKRGVFDALAAAGIAIVEVSFDGGGDEGQIESTVAHTSDNTEIALPDVEVLYAEVVWEGPAVATVPRQVAEAIETMAYDLLGQTHGGWENGEGAFGTFTFDVATRAITLNHNARYIETDYFEHSF